MFYFLSQFTCITLFPLSLNQNIDWYADIMEVTAKDIIEKFGKPNVIWASPQMCIRDRPYIMRYMDYTLSPFRGMYINIARWCNQPSFFKKKSFREFCVMNGENSACMKYARDFEMQCPDIAKEYYDMRFMRE